MLRRIRGAVVIALAAGLMWNCSGERVTQSEIGTAGQIASSGEPIGRPLGKSAVSRHATQTVAVVTVQQDGAPVSGATVELSRAIAGRKADYQWSATTDDEGQARVEIASSNATGYYQARASQDEGMIGSWSSIPINGGYRVMLDLPIGGRARVTDSSVLGPEVTVGEGEAVQVRSLLAHSLAASLGSVSRHGVELAVQDFGSVHGYEVALGEPVDGGCGLEGGRAGAEQIIADPQVVGVIGTNCSGAARAASPVLSAAGLVMVSPSNTSPFLTSDLAGNANSDYHPGYFRVDVNDLYKGRAVADFVYSELGLRRMVGLDDGDAYTTALVSAFGDAFQALGGVVAATERIEKGTTDMTSVLAVFAAARPEGIFFPLFEEEGAAFVKQVRMFDDQVTLISGAALFVSNFLSIPESEGVYMVGPETDFGSNVNVATGKNADEVLAAYQAQYGTTPASPYWAHAYDATTLLLSAIRSVAMEVGGKLYIDRLALREELGATAGFQALIAELTCDDFGDCAPGRINIHHHNDLSITDPAQVEVVYRFSP